MYELELTRTETITLAVLCDINALCRNGRELAVEHFEPLLAINDFRAGDELVGIDHMRRATRMQNSASIRERAYELAGAACMIQVHVGQEDVVHGGARDPETIERGEQIGNREIRPHIDECRATGVLNDVRGGMTRMQILRVDGRDAMWMAYE